MTELESVFAGHEKLARRLLGGLEADALRQPERSRQSAAGSPAALSTGQRSRTPELSAQAEPAVPQRGGCFASAAEDAAPQTDFFRTAAEPQQRGPEQLAEALSRAFERDARRYGGMTAC